MDVNSSGFGTNVRPLQYNSKAKGSNGLPPNMYSNSQGLDKSIFKTSGGVNIFNNDGSSNKNVYQLGNITYKNKYAMLNAAQNKTNTNQASTPSGQQEAQMKGAFSVLQKGLETLMGVFKSSKGSEEGSKEVDTAVKDLKNASDAKTLSGAVDGAKKEQVQSDKDLKQGQQGAKAAETEAKAAGKKAEGAKTELGKAEGAKDEADSQLSGAQTEQQQAQSGYDTAKSNTASAQQSLDQAKANVDPENPATQSAVLQAEGDLARAKQEESLAKQKLDTANGNVEQAKSGVESAASGLKTASAASDSAGASAATASSNADAASGVLKETQSQNVELKEETTSGEQRLEQMENTVPSAEPLQTGGSEQINNAGQTPQGLGDGKPSLDPDADPFNKSRNKLLDNYSDEDRGKIVSASNSVQNLQPGQEIKIGADTYSKDSNGTILVNGKDSGATPSSAADSQMRDIDTKKQRQKENAVLGQALKKKSASVNGNSDPAVKRLSVNFEAQTELLKSGKVQLTKVGNKLVSYENGKYVTYDNGKTNRKEVTLSELKKLANS